METVISFLFLVEYEDMKLNYKLTKDEIRNYYQEMLENDDAVFKFRWRLRLIVPVGLIVIALILKKGLIVWLITIAACVIWFWVAEHVIYRQYEKRVIDGYMKQNSELQEMHAEIEEGQFKVNNHDFKPVSWAVFRNLTVIMFENNSNLIIPDRVMTTSQHDELLEILNKLMPMENANG